MKFLPVLLPIVILGVVGIAVWLTVVIMRRSGNGSRREQLTGIPNTPPSTKSATLLQVRHLPSGAWEIRVQGQRYAALESVPDEATRREVIQGIRALAAFARNYARKKPSASPAKQRAPTRKPAAQPAAPAPERSAPATASPAATPPAAAPRASTKREPPSPTARPRRPVGLPREPVLKRHEAAPSLMPTIDLAREIGDIVDEMKTQNPDLLERSIRLYNAPGGGIYFAIDGITYNDVTEIPDLQIQGLIRAATKEWERR